jgi:hypothetical protein
MSAVLLLLLLLLARAHFATDRLVEISGYISVIPISVSF